MEIKSVNFLPIAESLVTLNKKGKGKEKFLRGTFSLGYYGGEEMGPREESRSRLGDDAPGGGWGKWGGKRGTNTRIPLHLRIAR